MRRKVNTRNKLKQGMNQKSPIEIKIIDIAYLTELKGGAKLSHTRWRKRKKEYNGNEKYNYI